jgi:hypothetical protein
MKISALALIALTLTACQTTRLSDANRSTICIALSSTAVTVTRQELAALSPETIQQIKRNPAVRRELGC